MLTDTTIPTDPAATRAEENRGFLAGLRSAAANLAATLGISRKPHAPSAGPADAVPPTTPRSFKNNLLLAAARLTGHHARAVDDMHAATCADLRAEIIRLEGRSAELTEMIAGVPASIAWLQSVTIGGLSTADHPPRNEFEQRLLDSFQEGLAARIRALGIPTSLLSGAA